MLPPTRTAIAQKSLFFTKLPLEIRLQIYTILHTIAVPIRIELPPQRPRAIAEEEDGTLIYEEEDETTSHFVAVTSDSESPSSAHYNPDAPGSRFSSQLFRCCSALYIEATPYLYTHNTFNFSQRESYKVFLAAVGARTCALIRKIYLDWESLIEFSWSLAKDEYQYGSGGLQEIQLLHWRVRHVEGQAGTRNASVRSYERQLCQCAADIVARHRVLRVVAMETKDKGLAEQVGASGGTAAVTLGMRVRQPRIKWRFVPTVHDMLEHEEVIDVTNDLIALRATKDEADETGFHTTMNSPG